MKYFLALFLTLFGCQAVSAKYDLEPDGLPSMGNPSDRALNAREESEIGQQLIRHLRRELPIIEDVELNYYLQNLGAKLASEAGETELPFTFLILESPIVNAFALPGGVIVVHSGLIELASNEGELAAVLAHEIAHVTQRHLARFYQKSQKINIGTTLGILAAIAASAYSPSAGQAALYTGLAASASAKIGFTRSHEREADRIGGKILARAGYNKQAMSHFFARLRDNSFVNEELAIEFLSTHPFPSSRIADQFTLPTDNPKEPSKANNSLEFKIFQARTKGLSHSMLNHRQTTQDQRDSMIYSRAIALLANNRPIDAKNLTKSLSSSWKESVAGRLLHSTALTNSQQLGKSIPQLESLVKNYPQHPAAREALASAYLAANKGEKAYYLLNDGETNSDQWLPLLKLKAAAASKSGRQSVSHATMAAYYEKTGLPAAALAQIEIAEHLPATSKATKARLSLLKNQLQKSAKEE